jgi:hypothetical protein
MDRSAVTREVKTLVARARSNTRRTGGALLAYSALLLVVSVLLAMSWAPSVIIVAALLLSVGYAATGVAVLRQRVWRRPVALTSAALHTALTVAWTVLLVAA